MLLGCIADDFTGASDIANTLAKGGMAVTQYNGVPKQSADMDTHAGVISLKSRTVPVDDAIEMSLGAARWLLDQGCEQLYFKYCSTFDSTQSGNIGPVAEALSDLVGAEQVLFCPAFPTAGRSVYQGNLFVGDKPLHESSMKDHPLTPMTDSDLRRWLRHQTNWEVKHIPYGAVSSGPDKISETMNANGKGFFIADAINDVDLVSLGTAASDAKLLTGGSGLALGLPDNFKRRGVIGDIDQSWKPVSGRAVVLSGSCSEMTRKQVTEFQKTNPAFELSAKSLADQTLTVETVCDWVNQQERTPLVYSSADPEVVRQAQNEYGQEEIAEKFEEFFGHLAARLVQMGVKRIISAGGETSGSIVKSLEVNAMEIGPEIAPGVPALKVKDRELGLALKSGNFGNEQFFEYALKMV